MNEQTGCEEVRPLLPELALGVLAEPERSIVLRHVWSCSACSTEVGQLTYAGDQLLLLTEGTEPPPGFAAAALAKLSPERSRPDRKPWRRLTRALVPVLAAALAAVITASVVLWRTADVRQAGERYQDTLAVANGRYFSAWPLMSQDGERTGTFFIYAGNQPWGMLAVSSAPVDGRYAITVTDVEGAEHRFGICHVRRKTATCGFPLELPSMRGARVHLSGPGGTVLSASARTSA